MEKRLWDMQITTTRPATVHPNPPAEEDGPQTCTEYHHMVNLDGKVHYDKIKELAEKGRWEYI